MKQLILAFFCFAAQLAAAEPAQAVTAPPLPPPVPSPLVKFRSWLAMSESDREKAIASYPAEKQKILREKLRAYQALPNEQRERRLNMLELRWYLRPLMTMRPEERAAHLRAVPPPLQPMVIDRLSAWDKLEPQTRVELLASEDRRELVMAYFAQIRRGVPQNQIFSQLAEPQRTQLQNALASWNKTPPAELQRRAAHIGTFFETLPSDQARTLAVLDPAEQTEIQRTLDAFAQLPTAQRRACINSFQKFATMAPEERRQFLRNAERWREMTPREREIWKQLVTNLPPMPPEPEQAAPVPPLPDVRAAARAEQMATN